MAEADRIAPVLTSLVFPTTIDVTAGGRTVAFTAGATDEGLGVDRVLVAFRPSWQGRSGAENSIFLGESWGDSFADGRSSVSEYFDVTTGPGTYAVNFVVVYDKAGNSRTYQSGELASLGFQTSFTVVDGATQPPAATAYVTAPPSIGEGDGNFAPTLTLDNVAQATTNVSIAFLPDQSTASGGDARVPAFSGTYTISQSPAGRYVVTLPSIELIDDLLIEGTETLAIRVTASGQRFENGTDTTIVRVSLLDNDRAGTANDDVIEGGAGREFLSGLSGNDRLSGLDGDDRLEGGAGDDVLIGGAGLNVLVGGMGDDALYIGSDRDLVMEGAGGGRDALYTQVSYVLAQGQEIEFLYAGSGLLSPGAVPAINLTGNEFGQFLYGNDVANTLSGLGGADWLRGYDGDDTLLGGADADTLEGGRGRDTLTGGAGTDEFRGTLAELAGDTITDLALGERIHVTDAGAGFGAMLGGTTLTFSTGATMTVANGRGLTVSVGAAQGGSGYDIIAAARAVDNDVNGDGRADILWRNATGYVTDWFSTGRDFTSATGFGASVSSDWKVAGNGDFDGDARADILWRNDNGRITTWRSTGNGFDGATGVDYFVGADWKVGSIGDFTGDGLADILWRNDSGRITMWRAAGGGFDGATGVDYAIGTEWKIAGTGDFTGDGREDILWRNDNGRITIWAGSRAGFDGATRIDYQLTADWKVAGVADFNGDGHDDILWRNDDGQLTEWFATANGGFAAGSFSLMVDTAWQVADTADYDGDGRTDILWRNTDGTLAQWLSTGSGFTPNPAVNLLVPTEWSVIG